MLVVVRIMLVWIMLVMVLIILVVMGDVGTSMDKNQSLNVGDLNMIWV
jgi:hypothetical protein